MVGARVGVFDGVPVGLGNNFADGLIDGAAVGEVKALGVSVGNAVAGSLIGESDGLLVDAGEIVSTCAGERLGAGVNAPNVGAAVVKNEGLLVGILDGGLFDGE